MLRFKHCLPHFFTSILSETFLVFVFVILFWLNVTFISSSSSSIESPVLERRCGRAVLTMYGVRLLQPLSNYHRILAFYHYCCRENTWQLKLFSKCPTGVLSEHLLGPCLNSPVINFVGKHSVSFCCFSHDIDNIQVSQSLVDLFLLTHTSELGRKLFVQFTCNITC